MDIEIVRAAAEGREKAALVTIVAVKGSVPRHPGSKMLVLGKRGIIGTVGGGRGELLAIESGEKSIEEGRSRPLTVEMLGEEAVGSDMICGGVNRMIVEYLADRAPYAAALRLLERGERVLMVKRAAGGLGGEPYVISTSVLDERGNRVYGEPARLDQRQVAKALGAGKPSFAEEEGVFYDPIFPEEKLLICGGGHVGLAIARLAAELDFKITVADSREEFLRPGRFAAGVETRLGPYAGTIAAFPFDSATYAIIVTPGHLYDLECVRAVLGRSYRYAGLIGSARKTKLILEQAKSDGFDPAKVDALYAPIGLDIEAETPEEIAISILAELVAVRRNAKILAEANAARAKRRA